MRALQLQPAFPGQYLGQVRCHLLRKQRPVAPLPLVIQLLEEASSPLVDKAYDVRGDLGDAAQGQPQLTDDEQVDRHLNVHKAASGVKKRGCGPANQIDAGNNAAGERQREKGPLMHKVDHRGGSRGKGRTGRGRRRLEQAFGG
jgi:hypothetical protein